MQRHLNEEDNKIEIKILSNRITSFENVVESLKADNVRMKAAIDSLKVDKKVIYFFIFTFDRIRYFQ